MSRFLTLVVGERANAPADPRSDGLTARAWLAASLRAGAFLNPVSRNKLWSVGVDLDAPGVRSLNLLPPAPQGVPFDRARAAEAAGILIKNFSRYDLVVLCGARVASAFGVRGRLSDAVGVGLELGGATVVVTAHPSGLSRWWNDLDSVKELRRCLSRYGGLRRSETREGPIRRSGLMSSPGGSRSA